jgi:FtsX-like permease family
MNLGLILKRTRRFWRQLAALAFSVCLVTAFFALSPMYIRAMVQSGFQYEVDRLKEKDKVLTLISPEPFTSGDWNTITNNIGDVSKDLVRISRASSALVAFDYIYGEPTFLISPRAPYLNHVFAFSNLSEIVRVVSGRLPERLAPPDDPARATTVEEEQRDRGLGIFSRGEVEGVITPLVAERTGYEIGTRIALGNEPENRVVVEIVGIVEPVNLSDPIWDGNIRALEGETLDIGIAQQQYNLGLIVNEAGYSDWVVRATQVNGVENSTYLWMVGLNTDVITADNIEDVAQRMEQTINLLNASKDGFTYFNPVLQLIYRYTGLVQRTEPPIFLLSGAILVMMLYHLVTNVSLVLEQQREEWAAFSSRGASTYQLVFLQSLTMAFLMMIGFLVGPLLAYGILILLFSSGPLALAGDGIPITGIPRNAYALSGIAALAAFAMLTLPAWPAAQRGMAEFKQIMARPSTRPAWSRYGLDLIFIVVGIGFIARLLFFIQGDLGSTLSLLVQNPVGLIQIIVDSANQTGGLTDPLNLLGPALLLTGIGLLWLRIFPLLIGLIGRLARFARGLLAPLSAWQVEREPGHYGQMVLLLIGTLALGTAALALNATRDAGTWAAAQQSVGSDIRVDLAAGNNIDVLPWAELPGVQKTISLIRYQPPIRAGELRRLLVGINPSDFPNLTNVNQQRIYRNEFDRRSRRFVEKVVYPAVISDRMATDEGRAFRNDQLPLRFGDEAQVDMVMENGATVTLYYYVLAVVRDFPSLSSNQHFLIMDAALLAEAVQRSPLAPPARANQVWLSLNTREPDPALVSRLENTPEIEDVGLAWERYNALLREPLPAAISGMLYAGFWVSLWLSLLDFAFYMAVTARRRSLGFAVLRALGWNINRIWLQLLAEQTMLILPALLIGIALGAILAYVILPFLALFSGTTLTVPISGVLFLAGSLIIGFIVLSFFTARWLRGLDMNRVLRLGEE